MAKATVQANAEAKVKARVKAMVKAEAKVKAKAKADVEATAKVKVKAKVNPRSSQGLEPGPHIQGRGQDACIQSPTLAMSNTSHAISRVSRPRSKASPLESA